MYKLLEGINKLSLNINEKLIAISILKISEIVYVMLTIKFKLKCTNAQM